MMPSARDLMRLVTRTMAPLQRRVSLMIARAVVAAVNDTTKTQTLQVQALADEVTDNVERFQDYGFSSVPLAGAEALLLSVGGNRAHGVAVGVHNRTLRPKNLNTGDVALYTADGIRVYIDKNADLVRLGEDTASDPVALSSLTDDRIEALENAFDAFISVFNAHVHPHPFGPTSATATPGTANGNGSSVAAQKVTAA